MKKFITFITYLFFVCFLIMSFSLGMLFFAFNHDWVDLSKHDRVVKSKPTLVLDDEGNELFRFERSRRDNISINQVPDVLKKAFVAAEDHQFFSHGGISFKGIIRSTLINLYYRRVVQGASTITQQVARLLFLSHERSWWRKIKEIFLTMQFERQLSKDQILELYLNNIYFGRGVYGVGAACKRFWNKTVDQVSLDEAAVLAAVAKSARYYSPLNAPLTAKRRRNVILRSMAHLGFISHDEFRVARDVDLEIHEHLPGNPIRLYLQEWIRSWIERTFDKHALYEGGLIIKTTLNSTMQEHAEQAFSEHLSALRKKMSDQLNGAMLAMQVTTGQIKAVVGGYDFRESQFNRALQASRQLGSSFKPILYSLALQHGFDFDDVMVDEPFEMEMSDGSVWKPRNWTRTFEGPMTLARALTYSNNIIAIKVLLEIGVEKLVAWAKRFGFSEETQPYPSLALGTLHGTVLENAAAFNVFANNGFYIKPYFLVAVKNRWGNTIWEHERVARSYVFDATTTSKMIQVMMKRMAIACWAHQGSWIDVDSIGKTGSTNGAATMWFVGSTPEYTTAVYVGRDDNKPMGRCAFASRTTLPIWLGFMKKISHEQKQFYLDPSLKPVAVNWLTGNPVDKIDSDTVLLLK